VKYIGAIAEVTVFSTLTALAGFLFYVLATLDSAPQAVTAAELPEPPYDLELHARQVSVGR
jgi:hypothetical protein